MNLHGDHNSHQPSVSVPSTVLSDPRIRNTVNMTSDSHVDVCRNYVWGICNKHGQCKYRHECTLDEMKCIINFCHNYQNRNGCNLPNCTYLHASKEEETLFRTTGQLPRVLMERHAAMRAAAAAVIVPPMFAPMSAPLPPSILPPPPPPPPPTQSSVIKPAPSVIFTAPTCIPLNQPPPPPPPLPPNFDASVPPPSIKSNILKRIFNDICEVGPSKLRKADDGKAAETMCEKCIQRELSSNMYRLEIENSNRQKEYKKLIFKSKSEENENMKTMMRFLLPIELCLAVEEYMEGEQNSTLGLSIQSSSLREMLLSYLLNTSSRATSTPQVPSPMPPPVSQRVTVSGTARALPAGTSMATPAPALPHQSGVPPPAAPPFAPPPFQPGVPPPPLRAGYSPSYASGPPLAAAPPTAVPPAPPAAVPPTPPSAAPPAPPAPPPSNGHYAPYMLGGYSSHQYYPPYQ